MKMLLDQNYTGLQHIQGGALACFWLLLAAFTVTGQTPCNQHCSQKAHGDALDGKARGIANHNHQCGQHRTCCRVPRRWLHLRPPHDLTGTQAALQAGRGGKGLAYESCDAITSAREQVGSFVCLAFLTNSAADNRWRQEQLRSHPLPPALSPPIHVRPLLTNCTADNR